MSTITTYDPFDLPDWIGTHQVTWSADGILRSQPEIQGTFQSGDLSHAFDLLAVDAAYPRTVCPPEQRHDAHQAWHFGQVLLVRVDERVSAAVPGTSFDPDLICETISRVAKALGAPSANFTVA